MTGLQCGGGAGFHLTTLFISGNVCNDAVGPDSVTIETKLGIKVVNVGVPGDPTYDDAGHHGDRKSGAGLSGAMSSDCSTPTDEPTVAVSIAVASDVITDD